MIKKYLYSRGIPYWTTLFQVCHVATINLSHRAGNYRDLTPNYLTEQTILLSDRPCWQDTLCCPAAELNIMYI